MVTWISHRGYSGEIDGKYITENTMPAFEAAIQQGFTHIELDLHLSSDGALTISHDPYFTTLSGTQILIRNTSSEELKNIPLTNLARVAFFTQFAERFYDINWTLDIKPNHDIETLDKLMEWTEKNEAFSKICNTYLLLWNDRASEYARQLFPCAKFYATEKECKRAALAVLAGHPMLGNIEVGKTYSLYPRIAGVHIITKDVVRTYQGRGAKVLSFLPRNESETDQSLRAGVDEILTNGLITG